MQDSPVPAPTRPPSATPRILVADAVADAGIELLKTEADVAVRPGLAPAQLVEAIADYDALVVRSATKVTREVLEAARHLRVVGRAGVGVDNIDVEEATRAAQDHGGTLLAGPFDVGEAGRMAWVADPQGAAVGLWQTGAQGTAVRANEPGTNVWNELVVPDVQAALPFYEEVLGITSETQDWPGIGAYTTLKVDGRSVGGA